MNTPLEIASQSALYSLFHISIATPCSDRWGQNPNHGTLA